MDPSQPLANARHEAFARALALGKSQTAAARKAGYTASRARKTGSDLGTNRDIQTRVEWLQKQAAKKTLLTIQEKRQFLADVLRTPVGDIGPESPLCQKYQRTRRMVGRGEEAEEWETEKIEMPDKLKAIDQDNDLAGEGAEAEMQKAVTVTINRAWH